VSHDATNWAIKQRGLKPSAKVVLWHLCDRYHPDNGCFPSQETLANDCELSRSALNDHLEALEGAGLIRREQRKDAATKRQKSTCYRFSFEPDFATGNGEPPCAETGHGSVSENEAEPCPENAESRVRNSDTNLVREPVIEPSERASAREREPEDQSDQKKIEARGWALLTGWPQFAGMPKEPAMKVWRSLTAEERDEAERKFPAWLALLKAQKKQHIPAPSTYFGEKLWQDVPEPGAAQAASIEAAPFGKLWQAWRLKLLLSPADGRGIVLTRFDRKLIEMGKADEAELLREKQAKFGWPAVNALHDRARFGQGTTVSAALEPLAAMMEHVRVGSELFEAWKLEERLRGWPALPDPGKQEWVYYPAGGPDEGLKAFEAAVRGNDADAGARHAAE